MNKDVRSGEKRGSHKFLLLHFTQKVVRFNEKSKCVNINFIKLQLNSLEGDFCNKPKIILIKAHETHCFIGMFGECDTLKVW